MNLLYMSEFVTLLNVARLLFDSAVAVLVFFRVPLHLGTTL